MVGAPTLQYLKIMIRQNIIKNFPVKFKYTEIAEKIFGSDASTLKVRTTRQVQTCLWIILLKYQEN